MAYQIPVSTILAQPAPTVTLTKLNSRCFVYTPHSIPSPPSSINNNVPPTTILFLSWMNASPKHVAKYLSTYALLYPNARILLGTITTTDFFFKSASANAKDILPLLDALEHDPAPTPRLLIHLFSKGGCKTLYYLADTHFRRTTKALPASLLISDSAPGLPHFWRDVQALMAGVPRKNPLVYYPVNLLALLFVIVLNFIFYCTPFWDGLARGPFRVLSDDKLIKKGCRLVYVYSEEDLIIDSRDVERHAEQAARKGWDTRMERFVGSLHVGHLRIDPVRYWSIVSGNWAEMVDGWV